MNNSLQPSRYFLLMIIVATVVFYSCQKEETETTTSIGVTLPITGDSPIDIEAHNYLIELAVEDVNQYFVDNNINFKVKADIKDSENSPAGIIDALHYFTKAGIQYVASSGISSNIRDAESTINSFEGAIIHSSSTAVSLAKNDNLFRIIPNDLATVSEISDMLESDNIKKLIILYRTDDWGTGLDTILARQYEALGNEVYSIAYDPRFLPDIVEEVISEVEAKYDEYIQQSTADEIGLTVFGFNEISDFLISAAITNKLLNIKWYGSDGFVINDFLVNNSDVAPIAATVNISCPAIAEPTTVNYQQVQEKVEVKLGYSPRTNNYLIYDAFWAAAIACSKNMTGPVEAVKQAFTEGCYISGSFTVDENGDREDCEYELWHIVNDNGTYCWSKRNLRNSL